MPFRKLVEADCGGVNPLMQLGNQFNRDLARKDEVFQPIDHRQDKQMVNEFLEQVTEPPQSFQMNALLKEMQKITQQEPMSLNVAENGTWAREFGLNIPFLPHNEHLQPRQQQTTFVNEFFEQSDETTPSFLSKPHFGTPFSTLYMNSAYQQSENNTTDDFFEDSKAVEKNNELKTIDDWMSDYEAHKEEELIKGQNYNEQFWQRLQDQWQKLSDKSEHPWLSEYTENYDPYKEYEFVDENAMSELENALEMGKEYLSRGDIPNAVLCFEVAAKKEPESAEIWELLGISQSENEMDPQSIAALKRSLEIKSDNPRVLMALAVSYTNESLQSHALKMLKNWLEVNPKYKHLVVSKGDEFKDVDNAASVASFPSSLIHGSRLQEVQELFLAAVRQNPNEFDADVQEALGVLYNLSAEYDKAVDCFRAALQVSPQNAKLWNRLGASLANGSRSVEAVEAYQQALQLEPGFIRVRYNVGVCCMNLKAYKQAVEHLLTALNMQANTGAAHKLSSNGQLKMSESIWSTLRMVISLMGRNDLHGYVTDRNLEALNKTFED